MKLLSQANEAYCVFFQLQEAWQRWQGTIDTIETIGAIEAIMSQKMLICNLLPHKAIFYQAFRSVTLQKSQRIDEKSDYYLYLCNDFFEILIITMGRGA